MVTRARINNRIMQEKSKEKNKQYYYEMMKEKCIWNTFYCKITFLKNFLEKFEKQR